MENRYHTTNLGTVHTGHSSDCPTCKRYKKQRVQYRKEAALKKAATPKEELPVCIVPGCKNTIGPTNSTGYCRACFLRSSAWKDTQKNSLKRVKPENDNTDDQQVD